MAVIEPVATPTAMALLETASQTVSCLPMIHFMISAIVLGSSLPCWL